MAMSKQRIRIRVVGINQPPFPSKSSNGQPDQGLLQTNFDLFLLYL